jgi:hypothetical protein
MAGLKTRIGLMVAAAMTVATLSASPAQAYDVERPPPKRCAAMYWVFAGPNHDDPQYLAMHNYARDHDAYTRTVKVNSGFSTWERLSEQEAFAEDQKGAIALANDPEYQGSDGLTQKFQNEMYICSIGYLIRVPARAITDFFQDGDYERLWAQDSPRQRQKLEAEAAREQANANAAAQNKAYGQANSALSRCMSMPSSVDMANPNYPTYTKMKWQCEDIRREAIRIAQSSGDNATAMSYINMRFPWQ